MDIDAQWMRAALELARKGWGQTHPNPMVGAVIVEGGKQVAEGFHVRAGGPHAERVALDALGRRPGPDSTLYVTLEPCSTRGRTPPCTDALIESGIRRVVFGAVDPNPRHAGRASTLLREAGIEVIPGVRDRECHDLNLIFNHWISTGRPLVALKLALTLDGCMATRAGDSKWITSERTREDVARWRRYFQAVVVGAETVLQDDPRLTSRLPGQEVWSPRRFVLDSHLRTMQQMPQAKLFRDEFRVHTTLVASIRCDPRRLEEAEEAGVGVWLLPPDASGRPRLDLFVERCRDAGICGLWVEGGARVADAWLRWGLVDYLFAYSAPVILGDAEARRPFQFRETTGMDEAIRLRNPEFAQWGGDRLIRGFLEKEVS